MNKFDSHVILFEKWLLNASLKKCHYEYKSMRWTDNQRYLNQEVLAARPYLNYRLLDYLKDKKFKGEFFDYTNEFRNRQKHEY